ncbi:MAG TPA: hypothetical protein VGM81_18895 [Burkholderiaceae bacterium]|jgi:hypothetical protein
MKLVLRVIRTFIALVVAALATACGGGGGGSQALATHQSTEARAHALIVAAPSWMACGDAGTTCSFIGTREVRYAVAEANGQPSAVEYFKGTFTGSVPCSNEVFGDPKLGVAKHCWYGAEIVPSWKACADEGKTCTIPGPLGTTTRRVRYGVADSAGNPNPTTFFYIRTFTDPVLCDNSTFGDPAPGTSKKCWYDETSAPSWTGWVRCTGWWKGNQCPFSGAREVRIGTLKKFVSMIFNGGMVCDDTSLADPAKNEEKFCWVSPSSAGIPTPDNIAGKDLVGPITAMNNQVIHNKHITSKNGPCVIIPSGVTDVTIRDSEIGPCGTTSNALGDTGVSIIDGGYKTSRITVQRNVIHDMSIGVAVFKALHPLVIDRNYVYNIRKTGYEASGVQFNEVRGGSGTTKITCNVSDAAYTPPVFVGAARVEDHINMYETMGVSADSPIEIAYNRIRGMRSGSGPTGAGINVGDGPTTHVTDDSGYFYVHDNTVVLANNVAIAVSGGHDTRIENNVVDQRGPNQDSETSWPFQATNTSTNRDCKGISFAGSRATIAAGWAWNGGRPLQGLYGGDTSKPRYDLATDKPGACELTNPSDKNNYNDGALTNATPEATFLTPKSQCN